MTRYAITFQKPDRSIRRYVARADEMVGVDVAWRILKRVLSPETKAAVQVELQALTPAPADSAAGKAFRQLKTDEALDDAVLFSLVTLGDVTSDIE